MKKYLSFFQLRFTIGLQYRTAALAGVITQFAWGGMQVMMYRAFYRTDAAAFPMSLSATSSYVWLQQAFLAFFAVWMMENDIFDSIVNGNISYELCRPISIYNMWFARSMATRLARAVLRCLECPQNMYAFVYAGWRHSGLYSAVFYLCGAVLFYTRRA